MNALSVNSAVSEVNKEHITNYIRSCQANGIKPIRLRKSTYMLRDMAKKDDSYDDTLKDLVKLSKKYQGEFIKIQEARRKAKQ